MTIIYSECHTSVGTNVYRLIAQAIPHCSHNHDGTVCDVCMEIADVEMQMEKLHSQLKDLHERHRVLRTKWNDCSNLISKLPYDIASQIFLRCLSPMVTKYNPLELRPCSRFHQQRRPLILGSVCHSWREIVHATPLLWSMITFDIRRSNTQYIIHYLQYSRSVPLIVNLYDDCPPRTISLSNRDLYRVIALVRHHLPRIAVLCLDLPCELTQVFSQDFERTDATPALEELHIHCSTWDDTAACVMLHGLTISIDAPRPHKVVLAFAMLKGIRVDWNNVRHLSIVQGRGNHAHSPILDTLSLLSEAKQLRIVDLQFDHLALPGGTLTGMMITQNTICYLRLFEYSAQTILYNITLPNLQFLDLLGTQSDITNSLLLFLRRSKCPLISLSWSPFAPLPSKQELIDIFCCTPKLQRFLLDIFGGDLSDDIVPDPKDGVGHFLDQLGMVVSHGESEPTIHPHDGLFLPLLQKFIFVSGARERPPLSRFLDAIESRNRTIAAMEGNQVAQPLQELEIHCLNRGEPLIEDDLQRIRRLDEAGQKISFHEFSLTSQLVDTDMHTYYRDASNKY